MDFQRKQFAYWVGLTQSDGSLSSRKNGFVSLAFAVNDKVLAELFRDVCNTYFNKALNVSQRSDGRWCCGMGVNKLLKMFESLGLEFRDPQRPPSWISRSDNLFGAYLAGIIDGDGNVRIKRPKYPQCVIRITSGHEQTELSNSISKTMKCGVSITKRHRVAFYKSENRLIDGTWYDLEFLVSSKNMSFMKSFVLPYVLLESKHRKIKNYILYREHN